MSSHTPTTTQPFTPLLNLSLRYTRPCSRSEIKSVGISPSTSPSSTTAAYAIYSGAQTDQSWIDVFDLTSQRGYSKVTGPQASFSPSGNNRIATLRDWTVQLSGGVEYHYSSSIMIRDFNSGKTALELKEAQGEPVAWSRDGRAIAASEGRGRMGVWDARTGARIGRVISHIDIITHAAFTPEGNIVTLSRDGTVRLTNPLTSKTISRLEIESSSTNPRALAVSPDGKTVTSIWGTTMHIWRPHESCLTSYNLNSVRRCEGWPLCISPDSRYLACRTEDGFDIMEVTSGALLYEQVGTGGHIVTAADFSADSKVLLLGRMNGDVQVWDIQERKI